MLKEQYILIFAAIVLAGALYFFGNRKAPPKPVVMPANISKMPDSEVVKVDFDKIIESVLPKIDESQRTVIEQLNKQKSEADDKKEQVRLLNQLAQKWEEAKYIEIAAIQYQKLAKIDSTEENWLKAADQLEFSFRMAKDSTVRVYLLQNAIDAYAKSYEFDTTNLDVKTKWGACIVDGYPAQVNKVMQGIQMLLDVTRKNPKHLDAQLVLARKALDSGQYPKALERLNLIIEEDSENSEAYYYMGETYLAMGNKEKAIEAFKNCKKFTKNATFVEELEKYIQEIM